MKKRELGAGGPEVSALGLGCMGMSDFYGRPQDRDEGEAVATIHRALDLGASFLDTADMYGRGRNEQLVGKAIRDRRDRAMLATKFGVLRGADGSFVGVSGKPDYVREACEASLRRLGTDRIDLYYLHRVDPETPVEETVGAMARLVEEGMVRWIGLSEAAPATLRRASGVHPIAALQTEYSLWSRDPEEEILDACRDLGVGFVAYSPLGRGFLAGGIRSEDDLPEEDWRRKSPRFQGENLRRNVALADRIRDLAREKGCTPAQLALAWLLAQGEFVVPIPGTTRRGHLESNLGALDLTLAAEDARALGEAIPSGSAAGDRYTREGMQAVNR